MKEFILALLLLLLQTSVFVKYFSVYGISPDILTIIIILYALNKPIYESVKIATVIGLLEDILSSKFFVENILIKNFIVFLSIAVRKYFFTYGFYIKSAIIIFLSFVDIIFKVFFTFLKTGIIYISPYFILYVALNFLIFGVYYTIDEYKKG